MQLGYCIASKSSCHSLICITCNLLPAEPHILGKACTPLWTVIFQHSRNSTSIHKNVLSQRAPGQQSCSTSEAWQLFMSAQPPWFQWKLFFPLQIISFYPTSAWQWEHLSLLRLPIKATKCSAQNRIFSMYSPSTSGGEENKNCIGLWVGTPRTPGQFLMLSADYWAKAQLYVSNCCHKEMSHNDAQTSKSACYFKHKTFIKDLKCLSSPLFPNNIQDCYF